MCNSDENALLQAKSICNYRKFKIFSNIAFMKDLEEHLTKFEHFDNIPLNLINETVNKILEKRAPTKKKMHTSQPSTLYYQNIPPR